MLSGQKINRINIYIYGGEHAQSYYSLVWINFTRVGAWASFLSLWASHVVVCGMIHAVSVQKLEGAVRQKNVSCNLVKRVWYKTKAAIKQKVSTYILSFIASTWAHGLYLCACARQVVEHTLTASSIKTDGLTQHCGTNKYHPTTISSPHFSPP